ncbi:MAG: hypothetical protein IPO07_08750 [Haliscomenobacter sp.]|nr:hypothetical protein [Haliscomenobacter sp.]
MENLWDSLLRISSGRFVMSPTKTDAQLEILDGQQRATAICLGFGARLSGIPKT